MLTPPSLPVGKDLQLERHSSAHGSLLKLRGVIDESMDRTKLLESITPVTVLDLDGVTRITSYGVREWINTLRMLPRSHVLAFVGCRPSIVSQFNMVAGFAGGAQLVSFYAPYLCNTCDHSFEVLIDLRRQYAEIAAYQTPLARCPKCRSEGTFDDAPESYLSYVASTPAPTLSMAAQALIDRGAAAAGPTNPHASSFRIQKEVLQKVTLLWLSGMLGRGGHFKRLADGLEGQVGLITAHVVAAKDAGIRGLAMFLQQPELNLSLPRVPLWLARVLAATPGGCGGANVVSLLLPFQCEMHAVFHSEIAAGHLRQIPGTFTPPLCPTCLQPGSLRCSVEELEELRQLPLSTAAPDLAAALALRPEGPLLSDEADAIAQTAGHDGMPEERNRSFGRYELIRRVGLGGMAEVFLARQLGPMGFEKRVVLKRILPQFSEQQSFIDMFLTEARLAARVSHSNVVQIFDLGQVGSQYFIAMEYVPGKDLALLLRVCRQLGIEIPVEVACRLLMGICAGLHAAHNCKDDEGNPLVIIHRDVSPHNVLVSSDGTVKVTDFGVAKLANKVGKTEPGVIKGKINYMAPELFLENEVIDGRVDVFAAGVILYQLLTQTLPFGRKTDAATMTAILEESPTSPSVLRREVSRTLDDIVAQALAKRPEDRFATAAAFEHALDQFMQGAYPAASSTLLSEWISAMTERVATMDLGVNPLSQLIAFTPSDPTGDVRTRSLTIGDLEDESDNLTGAF